MRVGEDVAVGTDDEARAFALALRRFTTATATSLTLIGNAEALEEILEGIVRAIVIGLRIARDAMRLFNHRDVDDCGANLLDDRGEIGQHPAVEHPNRLRRRGGL